MMLPDTEYVTSSREDTPPVEKVIEKENTSENVTVKLKV